MDERFYKVSESRLIELLEAESQLAALSQGGVDNWCWAGDSESDYLDEAADDLGLSEDEREDFDFYELAKTMLKDYEEV